MPALIFDCDGVLADTEVDGHLPAFNQAFVEARLPVWWDRAVYAEKLKIGGGKERIASVFTPELDKAVGVKTPEERAAWIARLHLRKTALFTQRVDDGLLPARPGVRRLVNEALAHGWVVAIASTSAEASVQAVLRDVVGEEAARRCQVFAGDIVRAKKPAPDIYLKVVADLGLDPSQCVVIEDSGIGVASARAAGLVTIVTVSSFTTTDDFTGATWVRSDLGEPTVPARVIAVAGDNPPPQDCIRLTDLAALLPSPPPNQGDAS
jgi:HAD superfamily hydrolase (TIGR01509 family)